jgi:hypothetical protein
MSVVVSLTLKALEERAAGALRGYARSLRAACVASPPPFGMAWYGTTYRDLAIDPHWLALSLVANAAREGEGARKLWRLAGRTADPEIAEQVRRHAVDESRHARLYIAMLETVFPGAVPERSRRELTDLSPGYRLSDRPPVVRRVPPHRVLDELIQMNLGEIRTRINQLLLGPVVTEHCPFPRRPRLGKLLGSLMDDETRHIAYTARLIEQAIEAGDGAFVRRTMRRRLDEFNKLTLAEVGESRFTGT